MATLAKPGDVPLERLGETKAFTELYALVLQAWELRDTPYLRDACEAIVEWHERQPLTKLERDHAFEAAQTALKAAYPDRYGTREE